MRNELIVLTICIIVAVAGYFYFFKRPPITPTILRLKYKIAPIDPSFINLDIRESTDGSYTRFKSIIYICCKDPETGQYYSDNTLIYVLLHEIAHTMTKQFDGGKKHSREFYGNFDQLIEKAKNLGIYDPSIPIPPTYCGLN